MSSTKLTNINVAINKVGLLLFAITASLFSYCQEPEEDSLDSLLDDMFFNEAQFIEDILESVNKRNFIYASIAYSSNTFFSGRDSGVDQFSLVPQLSYNHSSGINLSVSGIYYEEFDPNWDFTTVSLNYYNTIGKKKFLHFNGGYTRYFYNDGWDVYTNSLDAGIGIKNKRRNLGTSLNVNYLFGTDQSFQLISNTYFKQVLFKNQKFNINVKPQLNFLIAQQTIALEQLNEQGDENSSQLLYHDIFDLLNTKLSVPFSITTKSWDASIGYSINFPSAVATETDLNTTGYFTIAVGYLIDFQKKD